MNGGERLRMAGDEVSAMLIGFFIAIVAWGIWYFRPLSIARIGGRPAGPSGRGLLTVAPLVSVALVYAVLQTLAADDVRDDFRYLAMYTVLGAAWVGAGLALVPVLGLSAIQDVHERGNRAAAWAVAGAIVALALTYAGGNIGDGPGWWVVVFAAALATGALFLLWAILEQWTGISDSITVDRDEASGIRLAGFLIATALILGRAVAGDWVSAGATVRDFGSAAWPAAALLVAAGIAEPYVRPTPARPVQPLGAHGALPALLYLVVAVVVVVTAGMPS